MKRSPLPLLLSTVGAALLLLGGIWLDRKAPPPVEIGTIRVDGEAPEAGESATDFVTRLEAALLDRSIALGSGGQAVATVTLRGLGATTNAATLIEALESRRPSETIDAPLEISLSPEGLAALLAEVKDAADRRAIPARRLIDKSANRDETIADREGSYVDIDTTSERLIEAAKSGQGTAEIATFLWRPAATRESVSRTDVGTLISSFETRFGGAPGRNANVTRGATLLDGLVLMPGEVVSFNDTVGPRTLENGFFLAPEIYKGEIREGVGGGACQVASTLHAAAFFGGLDVTDRINHSRPSAYIRPGLDATVSFPVLDLRIRNPFDFPIIVSARADKGVLRFELYGKEQRAEVTLATETKGILKYSRKLETARLPEGEFRIKQKGKRGMSLRKIKTTKVLATGEVKVEETTDVYPPTQEIYLVAPGVSPDALPPLDEGTGAS